jgi:hypothetical protein
MDIATVCAASDRRRWRETHASGATGTVTVTPARSAAAHGSVSAADTSDDGRSTFPATLAALNDTARVGQPSTFTFRESLVRLYLRFSMTRPTGAHNCPLVLGLVPRRRGPR